jgi:Ca2+-binding EF-hand superfamily protein
LQNNPLQNIGDVSYPRYNFDDRFTDLEVRKFSDIFHYLDRDGNNQLRIEDLGTAMRAMGTLVTN